MKVRIQQIPAGEDEVLIRCKQVTPQVEALLRFLDAAGQKLVGMCDGVQLVVEPQEILYIESVDGRTFLYTARHVVRVEYTLAQLDEMLGGINFFRCSKSMILNIDKVKALKSLASNRIDATMQGGEHILISRTYASEFRRRLKGGKP